MLQRHPLRLLTSLALIAGLAACGSGSSPTTTSTTTAADTTTTSTDTSTPSTPTAPTGNPNIYTLGTRAAVSQPYGASAGNAGAVWTDYNPAATYPGTVTQSMQFITMPDGTKLAATVTLPADASGKAAAGPFPAILIQTPYNSSLDQYVSALGGADPFIVEHGYATVVVDVRGTGNSGGQWSAFGSDEQSDYGHVVDWVTQQTWSNGNIGLYGVSYLGITTVLTAEQQKPAVKAAFPIVPIGDGYRDTAVTGGQISPIFLPIWLGLVTGLSIPDLGALQADPLSGLQVIVQHLLGAVTGFQVPTILKGLLGDSGTAYDDGTFWSIRSPIERADKINVPTFLVGGLYDLFQRSEPLWFERLKNNVTTKLLIGPWQHIESAGLPSDGLPADGVPPLNHIELMWFDQYVKGMNVGADKLPNVTQYVLGYGHYVTNTDWPNQAMTAQRLYLHGDKSLSATAPTDSEASSTIAQLPLFGLCSESLNQWTMGFSDLFPFPFPCFDNDKFNQIPSAVFSTPAMTDNYYINGPIEADIWVSTTSADAGLSVRVSDYDPSTQKATPLSNGLLTASLRAVDDTRSRHIGGVSIQPWHPFTTASVQPVTSGKPMLLPVEIFPTSAMIAKGHQLQISIAASNLAQGLQPVPTLLQSAVGAITVYNTTQYPSSVVLPVVPASQLTTAAAQ